MSDAAPIFDRQPGESAKAFAAFVEYRELGVQRSLEAVRLKVGKCKALMERWSSRHSWVERVTAYDADRNKKAARAEDEALKKAATRRAKQQMKFRDEQVRLGRSLLRQAQAMLAQPLVRETIDEQEIVVTPEMVGQKIVVKQTTNEPTRWSKDGAGRLVETGAKLVALGLQMPTDSLELSSPGGSPIVAAGSANVVIYMPEKRELPHVRITPAQTEEQKK